MKYIRTKDGIFEFAKRFDLEHYKKVGFSNEDIIRKFIRNGNKLSDTIEELCDCFVVIRPQPRVTDHYILHRFAFVKEHCLNGDEMVYGAIWTDRGLIYVAKMNDKGELELL